MMRMPVPLCWLGQGRKLAGNTTPAVPRSQRIRERREGRAWNELGLSTHYLSAACPHLRARRAHAPDGRTTGPFQTRKSRTTRYEDHIQDDGKALRMNRSIKDATVKRFCDESRDQVRRTDEVRRELAWNRGPAGP
jgi:hypothetical protein